MRRFLSKWWWAVYLPLLLVSHLVQGSFGTASAPVDPRQTGRKTVELDVPMRGGGVAPIELAYLEWGSNTGDPAVVLLHGSPGNASTFTGMGQLMFHASSLHPGYRVLAPDLPGFGHSTGYIPDYSISFHADSVIAWLDALGVERAHLVGFSLGGGVILHVSERRPDLVASLTLLAAVGAEETEGSGAHWFEQLKYGVGYGALVIAPEMIPHFGVLGERQRRHAFLRNFFDTDQRPLRAIMEANEHPALILHGRHDPLIAPWAAERHHELMDNSRLVMLDDDHFFPFLRPMLAFDAMSRFLNRHSTPGAAIRTDAVYEVEPGAHPLGAWGERLDWRVRLAPAWLTLWLMVVASVFAPRAALVVGALLVPAAYLDVGVVLLGALVGRTVRCRGRRWLRMLARTLGSLVLVAFLVGPLALAGVRAAEPPVSTLLTLLAPIVAYALLVLLPRVCTWRGRARLSASVRRRLHH
ncbi:MAG: alpha/beta fold hydrolase, partial [Planctomycetota bacterium]